MAYFESQLGVALIDGLTNITGSLFLSLLVIVILFIVLCVSFRLPVEFSALFILPLLLVSASITANIYPVLAVIVIYLGFLLGKNLFI